MPEIRHFTVTCFFTTISPRIDFRREAKASCSNRRGKLSETYFTIRNQGLLLPHTPLYF